MYTIFSATKPKKLFALTTVVVATSSPTNYARIKVQLYRTVLSGEHSKCTSVTLNVR